MGGRSPVSFTENKVIKECKEYLDKTGWFHFNIRQGKHCFKGISDRIVIKNGIVIFVEFKSLIGKQTKEQIDFEENVIEKGGYYIIVRSLDELIKCINQIFWLG